MVTALCFITAEPSRVSEIAAQIASIPQVAVVYSVTGELDLVAIVQVPDLESVPTVVTDGIGSIIGVITTETHIAFRTYRPDDLGAGFSLGY
jgi:DNA-binding Lrp family transcriptional regulator